MLVKEWLTRYVHLDKVEQSLNDEFSSSVLNSSTGLESAPLTAADLVRVSKMCTSILVHPTSIFSATLKLCNAKVVQC